MVFSISHHENYDQKPKYFNSLKSTKAILQFVGAYLFIKYDWKADWILNGKSSLVAKSTMKTVSISHSFIDMFDQGFNVITLSIFIFLYYDDIGKHMQIRKSLKQSQETKQQTSLGMA